MDSLPHVLTGSVASCCAVSVPTFAFRRHSVLLLAAPPSSFSLLIVQSENIFVSQLSFSVARAT